MTNDATTVDNTDARDATDNVLQFPVKFSPQSNDNDAAPLMRDAADVHDERCRHRKTTFDKRARIITCDSCGVNVDPFEVLDDVVSWIRKNEWRYEEMARSDRVARLARDVHLLRVTQGKNSLLIGNCYVSGYHVGRAGIPTDEIALGDYVSSNRLYRVRREGARWSVMFYDPAHGLKAIKHIEHGTLQQMRAAVCKHWLWLNNNSKAAGLA